MIETLADWNAELSKCFCCLMPSCPLPTLQGQNISRSLCAMTAHPSEYHIGTPVPIFGSTEVPLIEANVLYQSMKVTDITYETPRPDYTASDNYEVTLTKYPETVEDNTVGVPPYLCSKTRVNGNWSTDFTIKNDDDIIVEHGSGVGTWVNATSTPFGGGVGYGTDTNETFDDSGVPLGDPTTTPITRVYGPAWFNVLDPTTTTTTIESTGLKHLVTTVITGEYTRTLTVLFLDEHTTETAAASISLPTPSDSDWNTGSAISSFVINRVDRENGDDRITSASKTVSRYRWQIPSNIITGPDGPDTGTDPDIVDYWKGTYFKVTWNILTQPVGWDDTIDDPAVTPPDPLPSGWTHPQIPDPDRPLRSLSGDLTWSSFSGGDPNDPESWFSEWYDLEAPSVEAIKKVVNIRYECYRSPYGNKPETTGEAVELPDT